MSHKKTNRRVRSGEALEQLLSNEWYDSMSEGDSDYDMQPLDMAEEALDPLDRVQNIDTEGSDTDYQGTAAVTQTGTNIPTPQATSNNTPGPSNIDNSTHATIPLTPSPNSTAVTNTTSSPSSNQATPAPWATASQPFTHHVGPINPPAYDDPPIFGEDTFAYITTQTNLYARQNGTGQYKWTETSPNEVRQLIGMLMAMGVHKLPDFHDYWNQSALLSVPGITSGMPRTRFKVLMSNLHLNDNSQMIPRGNPGYDKLYKIRPLLDIVESNSQAAYSPHQQIAIDEAMVLFKGRSSMKQYMPLKPTKRGYKLWCLSDSHNGFLYRAIVYTGATEGGNGEDGLGAKVVKQLVQPLNGKGHHVYYDNFFSSVSLARDMLEKGNYTVATTRTTRQDWPASLKDVKALQKQMPRGDCRSQVVDNGTIQCLLWKDKKGIPLINTVATPNDQTTVLRRNKDGTHSEVSCPLSVKFYNAYMGGVDLFDARRKTYSTSRKSKKWWYRLFYFILDTAVVNSYIIYKETPRTKELTLKEYVLSVANTLMSQQSSRKRQRLLHHGPPAARFCERHFPSMQEKSLTCQVCHKVRTKYCCSDCCADHPIPLCPIPCFRTYHTKPV